MAMVKCKECGADISSTVKKCPSCGKDRRNFFMKHKIFSIILILIALSAFGAAVGGGDNKSADSSNKAQATDADAKTEVKPLPKVGETIKTDKFEITVTSVEERDKVGTQYISKTPAEGGVFVVVNVSIKNISDKPIDAFDLPRTALKDSKGTQYSSDIDATSYYGTEADLNAKVLSDLNPGLTENGANVYELSKSAYEAGGWQVYIKADDVVYVQVN